MSDMTSDHKVCDLERQIAVLTEQAKNAAMALLLAKDVAEAAKSATLANERAVTANLNSRIAIVLTLVGLILMYWMGHR